VPVLHFGVIDIPYVRAPNKRQRKSRAGTVTTGQVAGWLEDDYHVMEIFFELHKADIVAPALEEGLRDTLESLLMGAPSTIDPFGASMSVIESGFRKFLDKREMEGLGIPGVPTQAALQGKSKRFKRNRGPRRPSFIDSGLYQANFKSWVT
jgi:hypothetical protein